MFFIVMCLFIIIAIVIGIVLIYSPIIVIVHCLSFFQKVISSLTLSRTHVHIHIHTYMHKNSRFSFTKVLILKKNSTSLSY